jgi:hypothetical protein
VEQGHRNLQLSTHLYQHQCRHPALEQFPRQDP